MSYSDLLAAVAARLDHLRFPYRRTDLDEWFNFVWNLHKRGRKKTMQPVRLADLFRRRMYELLDPS